MLHIFLLYKNNNTNYDIINYITHINNINCNINLEILITILNTNKEIILNKSYLEKIKNINKNININFYNYSCIYNDSIYNEIISSSPYNILLFTDFNIYLSEPVLEYILLNNIKEISYIRTDVIELKTIPDIFYKNYNTDEFFNCIPDISEYINNEDQKKELTKYDYINYINNNNNNTLLHISNKDIIDNKLFYLNNLNDFLLINKNIILKYGFNINNKNPEYTLQYLILNLINNNICMTKLPSILSVYKKTHTNNIDLLNHTIKFNCSTDYNQNIDYKHYDYKNNNEKSIIRSHIRILNGINGNDLKNLNKELNIKTNELNITNNELNITNNELNIKTDELNIQNKKLEYTLELFKNKYNVLETKYLNKLKIINSNINNLMCVEINNF